MWKKDVFGFQFQDGAIKSRTLPAETIKDNVFQFQDGAIKSC